MHTNRPHGLGCVTWNVHRGRGKDDRVDPKRIVDVLASEVCAHRPEVLALQEADEETPPHAGLPDLERIEAETGLRSIHSDATLRWGPQSHGFLGAVLFLHPDFEITAAHVLDLPGHCHRGAVVVETLKNGRALRILTTHLSLGQMLRAAQMRTIGQFLFRRPKMQTLLLGDLNEWRPWSGLAFSQKLVGQRLTGPVRRTFPAPRPLLPLDRILSDQPGAVCEARVLDGPGIRMASDHRPLAARVLLA
ncbi:MAG: endonuclease [Rhodobacteraceae bacterium]|nr:MAG: endonuclease [Paracoccaceae bacterium]